jgi:Uma2 family endonuclease
LFEPLNCFLQTQQPISLPPLSEPEPDAAVVRGGIDDYLDNPPGAPDVSCVIEVADSSLSLDVSPKLAAYAGAGIAQYVVVDFVNNRVLSHEQPAGNLYTYVVPFARGEMVQLSAGSGQHVSMAVDRLLP